MGADYIYTYVDVGSSIECFVQDAKEFIYDADHDVIDKLMDTIYYDDDEVIDNPKTILLNLIEAFDEVVNHTNDIAILKVKDSIVVFTGGFSWGDDPTDSFDIVMSIKEIAIEMEKIDA